MTGSGASSPGSAARQPSAGVLIEIAGERLTAVTPGVAAAGRRLRLRGLTLPGLANAHSHAFQRALRGRTHAGEGSFWTWREQMYELAGALDPDSCFALSRAAFGEMALAGITCVGEFHYLHHAPDGTPYEDPNAMGRAVLAAARAAGLRITLLDACYLHGGIERFRDRDAAAWVERVDALAERGPRRASAPRSTACARSTRRPRAWSPSGRRSGRCTRTSPSSRRRTRTRSPRTAARRPRCSPTRARWRALHRDPRDAPDRRGRRAARRRRRDDLPVPDDRARPRRRHRARRGGWPTRARRSPPAPTRTR